MLPEIDCIVNIDDFVKRPISALCAISQNFITPWRDCILRNCASLDLELSCHALGVITKPSDRDFYETINIDDFVKRPRFCVAVHRCASFVSTSYDPMTL